MSDQKPSSWNRKRIIRQGVTLAFIGLTFFVIYKEGQHYISQVPQLFREADPLHVLGLFLLQCLTFILNAIVCILLLRFLSIKARFRDTLIVAAGNKLGNKLLPVVGGIAAGYYTYRKVLKISQGQAVFLMTAWTSLLLANYAIIIFVSSLFLPREVLRAWPLLIPVISIAFFGSVILGYLLLRDHGRNFFSIANRIYGYGNKFWHLFFSRDIIERSSFEKITAEVKEGFVLMAGQKRKIISPFLVSTLYYLMDTTILYFSFRVFGYDAAFPIVAFGFIAGALISLAIPASADPGISEATNTLAFIILGFPPHIALFAVILSRIITYWIWVPFSFFYLLHLRRSDTDQSELELA